MNNQTNMEKLITSNKKVFTIDDLAVIWEISDRKRLTGRIKYYLKQRRLIHIYKDGNTNFSSSDQLVRHFTSSQ